MRVLVDTNFLVAILAPTDQHHQEAVRALSALQGDQPIIAAPVLVELFYLINKFAHYQQAITAIRQMRTNFHVEPLIMQDMERMENIMSQYATARFDYTDAALMALSERLKIIQIYTFDRRDFTIFRPLHAPMLKILP